MLDPKIIRNNPEIIKQMIKDRGINFDVDKLIILEKERRDINIQIDYLRNKRNEFSYAISSIRKSNKFNTIEFIKKYNIKQYNINKIKDEAQKILIKLKELEDKKKKIDNTYNKLSTSIPNMIDKSVPIGIDEKANKEIRRWGKTPKFNFKIQNHVDICNSLDLIDIKRAAKVSGARFYYMKKDLARLNQAIINYAIDFLYKKKYIAIQTPYLINKKAMSGAIIPEDFENAIYKIQDEDLYLIGTSEHAIAAMHSNEILNGADLPIKYAGISTCFRKEAGAHGIDQKGIFRVHQFDKIEQFMLTKPDRSWAEHEKMLLIAEEFYQKIEIPYKIMLLSSTDIGKVSAKTYDIEAWMAGQNAYREIVSCSNCLDYQARRLKIRFRNKSNEDTHYVHTLNSTLVATSRILVSIIENFQTKDGHINIPRVLHKYLGKHII